MKYKLKKFYKLEPYLGYLLTPFPYFDYKPLFFRNIRKNASGIDDSLEKSSSGFFTEIVLHL